MINQIPTCTYGGMNNFQISLWELDDVCVFLSQSALSLKNWTTKLFIKSQWRRNNVKPTQEYKITHKSRHIRQCQQQRHKTKLQNLDKLSVQMQPSCLSDSTRIQRNNRKNILKVNQTFKHVIDINSSLSDLGNEISINI